MSIADRIMKKVAARPVGRWVCTPKDFLDLGSREAVDQALSRLVKAGTAAPRRPRAVRQAQNEQVAEASGTGRHGRGHRRGGSAGTVSGSCPMAWRPRTSWGLTNAVPARISFVTDGHSRSFKIDDARFRFRHAGPSVMRWTGKPAAAVVQALRWLGPDAATDAHVVSTLNRNLPDHVKADILHHRRDLPGWALPLARSLAPRLTPASMAGGIKELLSAPEQDRRDVFDTTASRLDTLPGYVETSR